MRFRTAMVFAACAALGPVLLGLAALAAPGAGFASLRVLGIGWMASVGVAAALARVRLRPKDEDVEARAQLALAHEALEDANPAMAAQAAAKAVAVAGTSRTRNRALTTLAWAALGQGYPERAKAALDSVRPSHELDLYCLAAVACARGEPELAIQALDVARTFGTLTCDGAMMLVDCHAQAHGIEHAVLATLQTRGILGAMNCEKVLKAARLAGANRAAEQLEAALRGESIALPRVRAHAG